MHDAVRGRWPWTFYHITAINGPQNNKMHLKQSKIYILQKKAIRAINNLAYNEHTNAYFKCNKILQLSEQYTIQISNYIFQVLHSNIDEEIVEFTY